jgi:formate dehydrogenase subunit delta
VKRDELIRMANQIARFFEPYPEDEAVAGVADHLEKFWTPAMRTQLVACLRSTRDGVEPLVVRACEQLDA